MVLSVPRHLVESASYIFPSTFLLLILHVSFPADLLRPCPRGTASGLLRAHPLCLCPSAGDAESCGFTCLATTVTFCWFPSHTQLCSGRARGQGTLLVGAGGGRWDGGVGGWTPGQVPVRRGRCPLHCHAGPRFPFPVAHCLKWLHFFGPTLLFFCRAFRVYSVHQIWKMFRLPLPSLPGLTSVFSD